jgi:autophagy-related protein 18
MGGYLPSGVTELWEPSRDFASLRLPTSGARCIVALSGYVLSCLSFLCVILIRPVRTMPQVMVVSSEGYFYAYNIDLENGGECSLMKQYRYAVLRSAGMSWATHVQSQFARFRGRDYGDERMSFRCCAGSGRCGWRYGCRGRALSSSV